MPTERLPSVWPIVAVDFKKKKKKKACDFRTEASVPSDCPSTEEECIAALDCK